MLSPHPALLTMKTWKRTRIALSWIRDGDCIRCTSHRLNAHGYPRMTRHGKIYPIARHILIRRLGDIPGTVVSRHTCDNKWCIRPDHIISGTPAENTQDWKERGQKHDQWGEKNSSAKFTTEIIHQIRSASGLQKEIGKKFGVSKSQVSRIKRRETWRHIP